MQACHLHDFSRLFCYRRMEHTFASRPGKKLELGETRPGKAGSGRLGWGSRHACCGGPGACGYLGTPCPGDRVPHFMGARLEGHGPYRLRSPFGRGRAGGVLAPGARRSQLAPKTLRRWGPRCAEKLQGPLGCLDPDHACCPPAIGGGRRALGLVPFPLLVRSRRGGCVPGAEMAGQRGRREGYERGPAFAACGRGYPIGPCGPGRPASAGVLGGWRRPLGRVQVAFAFT